MMRTERKAWREAVRAAAGPASWDKLRQQWARERAEREEAMRVMALGRQAKWTGN